MRALPGTVGSETGFARFLAELWGPDRETGRPGTGFGPDSYVGSAMENIMLRSAIRDGMTNENLLANLVFFKRHPERNGRSSLGRETEPPSGPSARNGCASAAPRYGRCWPAGHRAARHLAARRAVAQHRAGRHRAGSVRRWRCRG